MQTSQTSAPKPINTLKPVPQPREPRLKDNALYIVPPFVIMLVLWVGGAVHWLNTGDAWGVLFLGYAGLFVGVGIGGYIASPDKQRPYTRHRVMILLGSLLLFVAIVSDHGNMQIEGLFFGIFAGMAPYVIVHYLIAKLVGPLVFGRLWCGWACWYGMVFDILPYPFSHHREHAHWGRWRYVHFLGSALLVAILVFGINYTSGVEGQAGMIWFFIGIGAYYALGVMMALVLKDNRAFCKYLCPIAVPLRATSRFSLVKIDGTDEYCGDCEACVEMCPMNIRIKDYLHQGTRILSSECIMCLSCVHICPHDALKLSVGLDVGGREFTDYDPTPRNQRTTYDATGTPYYMSTAEFTSIADDE
jgi:ferredoxin-type protein NapH